MPIDPTDIYDKGLSEDDLTKKQTELLSGSSSYMGGQVSMYKPVEYTGYLSDGLFEDKGDPDIQRGEAQSAWDKWGNMIPQTIGKIGTQLLDMAGGLQSLLFEWGDDKDYQNSFTEATDAANAWLDKTFPMYRTSKDLVNFGDASWWTQNISGLTASVAGFALGGAGIAKGLGALGRMARISKGVEAGLALLKANPATAARLAQYGERALTASTLAFAEGAMSGRRVFNETYTAQLAAGESEEEAQSAAAQSAATTVQLSTMLNTGLNMAGGMGMFFNHGSDDVMQAAKRVLKQEAGESTEAYLKRLKEFEPTTYRWAGAEPFAVQKDALKRVGIVAREAGAEGLEELNNLFAEKTGIQEGKKGEVHGFLEQLSLLSDYFDHTMNAEGALNFVLGAIAGPVQNTVASYLPLHKVVKGAKTVNGKLVDAQGNPVENPEDADVEYYNEGRRMSSVQRSKVFKEKYFSNIKDKIADDVSHILNTQEELKKAIASGDVLKAEELRRSLFDVHNTNSVLFGMEENLKVTYEDLKNVDNEIEDENGLTAAMKLGLAKNKQDNAYKKKATDALEDLTQLKKLHDATYKKYGIDKDFGKVEDVHLADFIFQTAADLYHAKQSLKRAQEEVSEDDTDVMNEVFNQTANDLALTEKARRDYMRKYRRHVAHVENYNKTQATINTALESLKTGTLVGAVQAEKALNDLGLFAMEGESGMDFLQRSLTSLKALQEKRSAEAEQFGAEILESDSYNTWKEKPENKDKSLQDYYDTMSKTLQESAYSQRLNNRISQLEDKVTILEEANKQLTQAKTLSKLKKNSENYFVELKKLQQKVKEQRLKEVQETEIKDDTIRGYNRLVIQRLLNRYTKQLEKNAKELAKITANIEALKTQIKEYFGEPIYLSELEKRVEAQTTKALELIEESKSIEEYLEELEQAQATSITVPTYTPPTPPSPPSPPSPPTSTPTPASVVDSNTQPTSNTQTEITDAEYNDFIDKGVVTTERLNAIANKVKNREPLSDREKEIFTDKTSEINKIIATNQPTSNTQTKSKSTDEVYAENAKKAFIEGKIKAFSLGEDGLYLNTNGVRVVNGFKDNGNMDVFEASKVELTTEEKKELRQIEADRELGFEGAGDRKRELAKKIFQRSLSEEQPISTTQTNTEAKKADIEIGKVGNTEYEVKVDGVYYQGKKLNNPENKTHRQLIEDDIERRRQEELKSFTEREKESVKKSTKGTPINKDNPNSFKVGQEYNDGMLVIVQDVQTADNFDANIAENEGEGYTIIDRVLEYGEMKDGKQSKAPILRTRVFNNKEDADTYLEQQKQKFDSQIGKSRQYDKINAKYNSEIKALQPTQTEQQPTPEITPYAALLTEYKTKGTQLGLTNDQMKDAIIKAAEEGTISLNHFVQFGVNAENSSKLVTTLKDLLAAQNVIIEAADEVIEKAEEYIDPVPTELSEVEDIFDFVEDSSLEVNLSDAPIPVNKNVGGVTGMKQEYPATSGAHRSTLFFEQRNKDGKIERKGIPIADSTTIFAVLDPSKLLPGTKVKIEVDFEYKGDMVLPDTQVSKTPKAIPQQTLNAQDLLKDLNSFPLEGTEEFEKLVQELPLKITLEGKTVQWLHLPKWILSKDPNTSGTGGEDYRNVVDSKTDPFTGEYIIEPGNALREAAHLASIRRAILKLLATGEVVEVEVSSKEEGILLPASEEYSAVNLKETRIQGGEKKNVAVPIAISTDTGLKGLENTPQISTQINPDYDITPGRILALIPTANGSRIPIPLKGKRLSELSNTVHTFYRALELFLGPLNAKETEMIESSTGFNVRDKEGIRNFMAQYFTYFTSPTTLRTGINLVLSNKTISVVTVTDAGTYETVLELDPNTQKLSRESTSALNKLLETRYRAVAFSNRERGLTGLNDSTLERFSYPQYNPETGWTVKNYPSYNDFLLKDLTSPVMPLNAADKGVEYTKEQGAEYPGKYYFYAVNPITQYNFTPLLAKARLDVNEALIPVGTATEVIKPTQANKEAENSFDEIMGIEDKAITVSSVGTQNTAIINLDNLTELYNFTPQSDRNDLTPVEVLTRLRQLNISHIPPGYNPFKRCT
ncbi:MAG: hypothetical protein EKK63_14645 [Acinetobacter sp.]|uniref:hypothetical protein n=1 Tax=Acinetobacter sp. TaxID=472 RepID=UPI000FB85C51|nr:hypothetical protein [Acinetobacter sp.]RUP37536.1 MAG: hypothetical protein EKK63_14645 [Acinetobacter sp.]